MTPQETLSLSEIRKQVQDSKSAVASSASPFAGKIDAILKEFDEFADEYRSLWVELSGKISRLPSTTDLLDQRLDELWRALQAIISQYSDPKYKSIVEEGMEYLENIRRLNSDLFPTAQPGPDILIFIKKENDRSIARKYPYTNTFFIGINAFSVDPINNPGAEIDWTPIAHELGHYIYWNSRFKTKGGPNFAVLDEDPVFSMDIEKAFQTDDRPSPSKEFKNRALVALMSAWSEEIFADLIGTMLLGRDYVASANKLFVNQHSSDGQLGFRFTDDIEHPTPYLRSFVRAESLKLIEEKSNRSWSGFKASIESELGENSFETEDLRVGLFSMDGPKPIGFETVTFNTVTLQNAIKVVLPLIYDLYQTSEFRTDQKVGIPLIEARMRDAFLDSYVDISDILEKGDGPGFLRKIKKIAKRVIRLR